MAASLPRAEAGLERKSRARREQEVPGRGVDGCGVVSGLWDMAPSPNQLHIPRIRLVASWNSLSLDVNTKILAQFPRVPLPDRHEHGEPPETGARG